MCLTCGCHQVNNDHDDPRHLVLAQLAAAAAASGVSIEVAARRIYQEATRLAHRRIMEAAGVRCGCSDCTRLGALQRLGR